MSLDLRTSHCDVTDSKERLQATPVLPLKVVAHTVAIQKLRKISLTAAKGPNPVLHMYESTTSSNPLQIMWLVMRKDGDLLLLPPVYETIWQHCTVIHQGKLQLAINALQKELAIAIHNHQPIYCGKAVLFWQDYEIWTVITLSDWTMVVWWSGTAMEDVLEEVRSKQWGW